MAVEIILPRVDMDMQAAKVTQSFIGEGESVAEGKPLFEIETDKAAMEIRRRPAAFCAASRRGPATKFWSAP